ncbi:MAG: NAD(P)/FAD-dependent oxidoreductase [Clostridia bacterium]|nr:NAD(P)/FAD-dependent oxidoreductase [Clostridia bacterium]
MVDVLVIGAGPAGISAALYAKRAGASVTVLYNGESNLEKAHKIDNYYGFENGIDGKSLYQAGINQAKNLEIDVKQEEVFNIKKENEIFIIETDNYNYEAKAVIIATGNKKLRPNIKGVLDFEGKGISYCAICDGFFYRKKDVVVIGNGKFAIKEADDLKNIVNSVTILTNGEEIVDNISYTVDTRKIKEIHGENKVSSIEFEDGNKMQVDGAFIAIGEAGGTDFAKKLGVMLKGDSIDVDENMKTNIDGLYSCGNVNGGLLQVCKATYEGAKAGLAAVQYVKKNK